MNGKTVYFDKGKITSAEIPSAVPERRFCKYCGGAIDSDSVFCPSCGRQIILVKNENISSDRIFVNNTTVNNTVNNINYNNINMSGTETRSGGAGQAGAGAGQPVYVPVPYGKRIDKWLAFLLCLFLGPIGAHKFYEGRTGMGLLYLFTGGLFGLGWLADIFIILGKSDPYWVNRQ